jgi:AhpD family alkylhydroperoxidase
MKRLSYDKVAPEHFKRLLDFHVGVKKSGLDPLLAELVLIRCSQINQCLYCLDLHTRDARKAGETERRIYALNAWREASFYTDKERAALDLAESMTQVNTLGVSDAVYENAKAHFTEKELVDLAMLIASINAFNRLGVAFRPQPPKDEA